MATELASGYVSLSISTRGMGRDIARQFAGVQKTAAKAGKDAGKTFGSGFGGTIKGFLGVAGIAAGIGFLKSANAEAREAQKVGAVSTQIIKSTGGAAKVTAVQVGALAEAISNKTGKDDEAIQKGANLLLTFKNIRNEAGAGADIFDRATKSAVDLSAAGFGSIESASKQLGKALNDPIKGTAALTKAGVTFTDQQKAQIKTLVESGRILEAQKIILGEVESQVGGVAAASATMGEKVSVAFGNFKENVGTALLPTLDKVGSFLVDTGIPALTKFSYGVVSVGGVLGGIFVTSTKSAMVAVGALTAVFAAKKFVGVIPTLIKASEKLFDMGGAAAHVGLKMNGAVTGVGKFATFLGGPWGIAIGLGVTALVAYATKQSASAKETKAFTDTLTFQKDALDANSRASIAERIARNGSLDTAIKAGVAEKAYVLALVSGGQARQDMIQQLLAIAAAETTTISQGNVHTTVVSEQGKAAEAAALNLQTFGSSIDSSARAGRVASAVVKILGTETGKTTKPTNELEVATGKLKGANARLRTELQKVIDKFTILREGALGVEDANSAWQQSLDDVRGSVKSNGKGLDIHSEKGRANRLTIVNSIRALNDKIKADFESTAKTKGSAKATVDLSAKMKVGAARIRAAAKEAGLNAKETQKMIDKYLKTPKQVKTKVDAPGLKDRIKEVDKLDRNVNALNNKKISVEAQFKMTAAAKVRAILKGVPGSQASGFAAAIAAKASGGPVPKLAGGGRIIARGGPTQDNVAGIDRDTGRQSVWVSAKEFITNAKQYMVNKRQVETINRGGKWDIVPRRADGGSIPALNNGGTVNRSITVKGVKKGKLPDGLNFAPHLAAIYNSVGQKLLNAVTATGQKKLDGIILNEARRVKAKYAAKQAKAAAAAAAKGPGGDGNLAPQGSGQAAARRAGKRIMGTYGTTYPGHLPTAARAKDFAGSASQQRRLAAHFRANHGKYNIMYIISRMRIASPRNNWAWRQYHPISNRGDFRHMAHVHASFYDKGGILKPGLNMAINRTKKPERVLSDKQNKILESNLQKQAVSGPLVSGNTFYNIDHTKLAEKVAEVMRHKEALSFASIGG